jgi:hypothetical protein
LIGRHNGNVFYFFSFLSLRFPSHALHTTVKMRRGCVWATTFLFSVCHGDMSTTWEHNDDVFDLQPLADSLAQQDLTAPLPSTDPTQTGLLRANRTAHI